MISKFSQCIISGRDSMLIALLITAVSGCIVRGHHTFMVGFDLDTRSYLTFSTSIIAIPTGIKILNRLATIRSSRFYSTTPLYFIIGFLFSSTFGGFTGLISANSIIDKTNKIIKKIILNCHAHCKPNEYIINEGNIIKSKSNNIINAGDIISIRNSNENKVLVNSIKQ
jgi:hypothetical protein